MIFSIEEDQPLIDYYDVYCGSPPQAQILAVDIKRMFGNKDIAKFSKSVTKINVFSRVDFVGFWCVSGCMFVLFFYVFRGLQRRIAKNLDM